MWRRRRLTYADGDGYVYMSTGRWRCGCGWAMGRRQSVP
jgi:membrane-bound lytic murein transglycosylase